MINFIEPTEKYTKYFDQGFDIILVDIEDENRTEFMDFNAKTGFNLMKIRAWIVNPEKRDEIVNEMGSTGFFTKYQDNEYLDKLILVYLLVKYSIALLHIPFKSNLDDGYKQEQTFDDVENQIDAFDEYLSYFNNIKSLFKTVKHFFPHKSVLVIGDFTREATYFATYFEEFEYSVYRLATDPLSYLGKCDYDEALLKDYSSDVYAATLANIISIPMWKVLAKIPRDFDFIFITQNNLVLDFKEVNFPIYYYAHLGVHPSIPLNCKITGFFHAFLGAPELFMKCHRHTMQNLKFTALSPYAWFKPDWSHIYQKTIADPDFEYMNRKIVLGYMGDVPPLIPHESCDTRDYMTIHVRDSKAKVIHYLKSFFEEEFNQDMYPIQKSKTWLDIRPKRPFPEYQTYLQECMFLLNIGNIFGMITERQYHVMLAGGILVQSWFQTLEDLGYKDGVNCIIFKTPEEIIPKIYNLFQYPPKLLQVRQKGIELAYKNEYKMRTFNIIKVITRGS